MVNAPNCQTSGIDSLAIPVTDTNVEKIEEDKHVRVEVSEAKTLSNLKLFIAEVAVDTNFGQKASPIHLPLLKR